MRQDDAPASARLFFALWPNATIRRRLAAHCPRHGRPVPPQNWHVTLVFLGTLAPAAWTALAEAVAAERFAPFRLTLDRRGCWRRTGIYWLAASVAPPPLLRLQQALADAAAQVGVARETRPYWPHLTLARKARPEPETAIDPIEWEIDEFCLVRSETLPQGARYTVWGRWPLSGAAQPER